MCIRDRTVRKVVDADGDEDPLHCFSYCLLGFTSIRLGEQEDALRYAQKAFFLAREFEYKPHILMSMLVYAEVLLFQGNTDDAVKLLWMIRENTASSFATKHLAKGVLQNHAKLKDLEKVTFEEGLKLISAISVKE